MPKGTPTRRGQHGRRRVSPAKRTRQSESRVPLLAALPGRLRAGLGRQADDVWGLLLIVAAVLVVFSFFGLAGPVGGLVDQGLQLAFGLWSYLLPLVLGALGAVLIVGKPRNGTGRVIGGSVATFLGTLALFHLLTGALSLADGMEMVRRRGGGVGSLIAFPLRRLIGSWGTFVVLGATVALGLLVLTRTTVRELFVGIGGAWQTGKRAPRPPIAVAGRVAGSSPANVKPRHLAEPRVSRPARPGPSKAKADARPGGKSDGKGLAAVKLKPVPNAQPGSGYQLPPLELLDFGSADEHNKRALEDTAEELEETLRQHGVDAQLTKIVPGPTVTRFEIELAKGVKVNKVTNLAHDIAYALATPDIRLLAPIPGRSAIGVEVPNHKRRLVTLGDVLRSGEAAAAIHPLDVGLGMDINGHARFLNLAELPHVLIAGATGAGKSSCINSIVTSILVRTTPEDVRLILVDPKRVELGQYNGVPHLLTRVITNPKKAADALKWAVAEMDRRYDLVADAKVRDISGYREKLAAGGLDPDGFDRFPYLVVIIDELNDLMMVAGREVEEAIVRIAQMARAVGIHLVIATQRPSVDVITGVIKANIPSRLAFAVASQTDSRVIIDTVGADKLVGMGDMLVSTAKEPRPQRIQGAWVRESEIHAVVDWVRRQQEAQYQDHVVEQVAAAVAAKTEAEDQDADEELIRQAMDIVVRSQLGSTSMLQRKLRIGFARAGRVMDMLERRGVVGPSEGSKARAVLMTVDEFEESLAKSAT